MRVTGSGILEGLSTRVDGSVVLKLATQEMDSTDAGRLFELRNKYVKFQVSDTNIDKVSETLVDELQLPDQKGVKTPSQRLRAVLFRVNEAQGGTKESFDEFYKSRMEELINHFKQKLD